MLMSNFKPSPEKVREVLLTRGMSVDDVNDVIQSLTSTPAIPKWLVILLKVITYAIGLILAGVGTQAAAQSLIF